MTTEFAHERLVIIEGELPYENALFHSYFPGDGD